MTKEVCSQAARVCVFKYSLSCLNGNMRIVSCDGKLHGHNRGPCELQKGAELEFLERQLKQFWSFLDAQRVLWKYLGSVFGRLSES